MGVEDAIGLYERHAKAWAKARRVFVEKTWLRRFCALIPPASNVLDCGCGTGVPIARFLDDGGYAITGLDSSERMIRMFRNNLPGHCAFVEDMRKLQLSAKFEGILAWDSLFHLTHDDQRNMFARFVAHSAPGTALMFTSGPTHGEAIGSLQGEPLYHASLAPAEYRDLLDEGGFDVIAHILEDQSCGGRTVWLARLR